MRDFSQRLKSERKALGLSQEALAEKCSISGRSQQNYESGQRSPDADYLAALASAGADINFILTGITADQLQRLNVKEERIAKSANSGLNFSDIVAEERLAGKREQTQAKALLSNYFSAADSTKKLIDQAAAFILVPRHDVHASAGGGSLIHDESVVDHLVFKRQWLTQSLGCAPEQVCVIQVRGDSMTPTINDADLLLLDMRIATQRAEGVYVIQLHGSLLVKRLRFKINGTVDVISDNQRYGTETLTSKEADQLTVLGRVVWHGCKF